MHEARPLLIFDSGVGGLSVLQPIRALLPNAPIVYVADSAGYPYGTKTEREIAARVPALLGRLARALRSRADRDSLQHRLDDRAGCGAIGARPADRRHGAGDQAGGRALG